MRQLDTRSADFDESLAALTDWVEARDDDLVGTVRDIIDNVRRSGDEAVLDYTRRFDKLTVESLSELEISRDRLEAATAAISPEQRSALEAAAQRITDYHQRQAQASWRYTDDAGNELGQQITPLARAGIYVPGGKASYPSSVLMNSLPAKVAGVGEIVMVVPSPGGEISDMVLAAAQLAGVYRVFTIGGAQAVAALAFGTETIPAVDKIVGPGNRFVAEAKRQVFGQVGIDMVAGPSEILVICDGKTEPDWVAMDLFSQAEHDESAQAILLCPDEDFLRAVATSIEKLLPDMPRADIIRASLSQRGAMILTRDIAEAVAVSNRLAPEHLELSVEDPEALLPNITAAGAIFLGRYTTETLGDYCAGPNHVLPTGRTARFSSPLGVYDFQKRSSVIHCSPEGVAELGRVASVLAHSESLTAHARSAEMRLEDSSSD